MKVIFFLLSSLVISPADEGFPPLLPKQSAVKPKSDPYARGEIKMNWNMLRRHVQSRGEEKQRFLLEYGSSEGTWIATNLVLIDYDKAMGSARVRGRSD